MGTLTSRRNWLRLTALVFLLLGLGGTTSAQQRDPVSHDGGGTGAVNCGEKVAPTLTAFDFQARAVNVQTGPATVSVTASATDDFSGVRGVSVSFASPTGKSSTSAGMSVPDGGHPLAATVTGTANIGQFVEPGVWKVRSVRVSDADSNVKTYSPETEWNPAWPTDLLVTSDPDVTPPALAAFDIQPRVANTTAAPAELATTGQASDTGSGLSYAHARVKSPSGSDEQPIYLSIGEGGTLTGTLSIPQWVEAGNWTVESVYVVDRVGNSKEYSPASEWNAAWPTTIQVISNEDNDPPDLASFSFSPTSVNTASGPATVTVTAQATDNISGLAYGNVGFVSPSGTHGAGAHLSLTSDGGAVGGTLTGEVTLPQYSEAGTWKVSGVSVLDKAGNGASYSPSDPAWTPVLWPTDLAVTSAEPPPSTPAETTPTTLPPPCGVPVAAATSAAPTTPTLPTTPRLPRLPAAPTGEPVAAPAAPPAPAGTTASRPGVETQVLGVQATNDAIDNGRSRFASSLSTPGALSLDPAHLASNLLLAGAMVLLIAFPAELFNKTLEENRDTIRTWAWVKTANRVVSKAGAGVRKATEGRPAMWIYLGAAGLLYSFLDPNFPDGLSLMVASVVGIAAAMWTVTMVYEYGAGWFSQRWHGDAGTLKLSPGVLGIALACVLLSRIADFQPGYLYGLIAGVDFAGRLSDEEEGRVIGAAAGALLGVGVLAWLLWIPISGAAGPGANVLVLVLDAGLAAVFVATIEGLVFGLVPLRFLDGEKVKAWNAKAWAALFGAGMFLFFQVLLRPAKGGYDASPTASWATVMGLAVAFGAVSIGLWAYFRYFAPEPEAAIDLDALDAAPELDTDQRAALERAAIEIETIPAEPVVDSDDAAPGVPAPTSTSMTASEMAAVMRGEIDLVDAADISSDEVVDIRDQEAEKEGTEQVADSRFRIVPAPVEKKRPRAILVHPPRAKTVTGAKSKTPAKSATKQSKTTTAGAKTPAKKRPAAATTGKTATKMAPKPKTRVGKS